MALTTFDVDDTRIRIEIDRPDKRNALSLEVSEELSRLLDRSRDIPAPLVITSSTPGMFVAGTDIGALRERTTEDGLARVNSELFQRIDDHPWPTIAVVDGPALGGGCELALACDLRVASTRSLWGLPEVRLGIIPSAGGLWRLPRVVGWSAAVELIMTGRRIDTAEAERLGLVHRCVPFADLDDEVATLLAELGKTSLPAMRLAKEAMRVAPDHRRLVDAVAQAVCLSGEDAQQRLSEFLSR